MGLLDKLQAYASLPLEKIDTLKTQTSRQKIARKEALFALGDKAEEVFYIHSGVIKLSFFTHEGTERVREFHSAGQMIACVGALANGQGSDYAAIACAPCEVESISIHRLTEMAHTHLNWSRCISRVFLDIANARGERERQLLTLTATERLELALNQRPWLADQVTQQDLASYIGVTPVSLSRLKSRMELQR